MAPNGSMLTQAAAPRNWIASEVQTLQGQMAALQSALESSRNAVQEFQRRAAANLEASERRYRELFNNVPTGMYRLATDGRVLLANSGLLRMLGYDCTDQMYAYRISAPAEILH